MANTALSPLVAFACLGLAGCVQADPGLNAGAAASQAGPDVALATQPTRGQELAAVAANRVEITFAQGGTSISAADARQLDTAARLFRDVNPVRMFVAGHADATGDEYSNLLLSARRAQIVKRELVARGIPGNRLLLQAYGVSEPANVRRANARAANTQAANIQDADAQDGQSIGDRRVVVTWRIL